LDNQNIANRRDSTGTGKPRSSYLIVAWVGSVKETYIATRSVTTLRSHLEAQVLPLIGDIFARIKRITIVIIIEIDVKDIT
jgi:hypothetical protein